MSKYWSKLKFGVSVLVAFVAFVARNTFADRCSYIAAGLTVTTMLSLVPLMTVIFSVLSAFPAYATVGDDIQAYLFKHFVPNSGEQIQGYLSGFVAQASRLQALGIGILLVTALLLMRTIDKAFNVIWHSQDKRRPILVFLVYWAVLSLGPIFLGLSIGLTSYFITLPLVSTAFEQIGQFVRTGLPFLLTAMALSLMYWVIPNRRVLIRHACVAGLLAAAFFELAKAGFSFYLTNVPSYQIIFGTLAVLPIFLIWMYLSWMIVLLGAEICHALKIFSIKPLADSNRFVVAYRVINSAWRAFQVGSSIEKRTLLELRLCNEAVLDEVLKGLIAARWLVTVDEERILLAKDLSDVDFYSFARSLPWPLPTSQQHDVSGLVTPALQDALDRSHESLKLTLQNRLVEMYRQE